MDLKIAARMIAVFAIGTGLTAAIMALHDDEDRPNADAPGIKHPGGELYRKGELARCRDLGASALEETACRKAWAENRRRFFQIKKSERPTSPKVKGETAHE